MKQQNWREHYFNRELASLHRLVHLDGVVAELLDSGQDVFGEVGVVVDLAVDGRDADVTLVDPEGLGLLGSRVFHLVDLL